MSDEQLGGAVLRFIFIILPCIVIGGAVLIVYFSTAGRIKEMVKRLESIEAALKSRNQNQP